jgi:hypothetical protein
MGLAGPRRRLSAAAEGAFIHPTRRPPTMKKLRLNAEELRVESFPTAECTEEAGTVHAQAATLLPPSCPVGCQTYDDTICGLTHGCE